jgi:hypothetical protein
VDQRHLAKEISRLQALEHAHFVSVDLLGDFHLAAQHNVEHLLRCAFPAQHYPTGVQAHLAQARHLRCPGRIQARKGLRNDFLDVDVVFG